MRRFIAWRGLDEWRAEACTAQLTEAGLHAGGVQIGGAHRVEYVLACDADLTTISLELEARTEEGEHSLALRRLASGEWTANGEPLPQVEGALDCDLAFSPLTNFMPAKRLRGEPADHVLAWVDVPSLEVLRSEQRYEPLDERLVRYVGLDHEFTAELELDEDGFVVRYPGLAERVT